MKKVILILLLTISGMGASAQTAIKAGVAKANLTPPIGTIINGDFLPGYAQHIHDSLYARALAFDNGDERFVFVVVDNMTIDGELIDETKVMIKEKTGLLPEQVMISSTHAHSCGSVIETASVQADLSYRQVMPDKILDAVVRAMDDLRPARIAWGSALVPDHVSCRRWYMKPGFPMVSPFGEKDKVWMNPPPGSEFLDRPVSPTDPEVAFLAVKSLDDEWIGILANYSTHYVGDIPGNTISADYFGEIDVMLKSKLKAGEGFIGIMSNGTSGDVNTIDFRLEKNYPTGHYKKTALIANEIADSILVSLENAEWSSKPVFRIASATTSVARRQPSDEMLQRCLELVRETDYNDLGTTDKASEDIARSYALDVVKIDAYEPDSYELLSQAVRIGNGTIGTLPGEFFSETGLKLKEEANCEHYFTITLANAMVGYVPPEEQFELGGYETWFCSGSLAVVSAEKEFTRTLTKLIKSVQ
jgi:neutral ceramidase